MFISTRHSLWCPDLNSSNTVASSTTIMEASSITPTLGILWLMVTEVTEAVAMAVIRYVCMNGWMAIQLVQLFCLYLVSIYDQSMISLSDLFRILYRSLLPTQAAGYPGSAYSGYSQGGLPAGIPGGVAAHQRTQVVAVLCCSM